MTDVTTVAAFVGAALGILNFLWNLYLELYRRTPRLKVTPRPPTPAIYFSEFPNDPRITGNPNFPKPGEVYVSIDIANVGRGPVVPTSAGWQFAHRQHGQFLTVMGGMSRLGEPLSEGQSLTVWAYFDQSLRETIAKYGMPKSAYCDDATGRTFRKKIARNYQKALRKALETPEVKHAT